MSSLLTSNSRSSAPRIQRDLLLGEYRPPDELDFVEHALHQGGGARRDRRSSRCARGTPAAGSCRARCRGDAVGAPELLPDVSSSRDCSTSVIARSASLCASSYSNGPEKTIADLALGGDALLDCLFDDSRRRCDAEVTPGLVCVRRRQARDVGLDQRLDGVRRETADEDEGEIARVGKTGLVEGQRLCEVPLVNGGGGLRRRRGLFRVSAA